MGGMSIRARIIAALIERLQELPIPAGPRGGVPIGRDTRAWCEVDWASEQARSHSPAHDVVDLEVRVVIYIAAAADAESRADELAAEAHRLLAVDYSVDGLAQDLACIATVKEVATQESELVSLVSAYNVTYRRRKDDIALGYP